MKFTSILITGEMRSGTTFLANFLNSQSDITLYADMLVTLFMEAHKLGIENIDRALTSREKNILLSNLIQEGKNAHLPFEKIDRKEANSWFDLFTQSLAIINENENSIVGVKRTREKEFIPSLLERGVKVIYIYRDPRDVLLSAKNRFSEYDLFRFSKWWKESINFALKFEKHSNFLFIKYEELILNNKKVSQTLSKFLNIPVKLEVESFISGKEILYTDNSSYGDIKTSFDKKAVNRWKQKIKSQETIFGGFFLEKEIIALGYEKSPEYLKKDYKLLFKTYKKRERLNMITSYLKHVWNYFLSTNKNLH